MCMVDVDCCKYIKLRRSPLKRGQICVIASTTYIQQPDILETEGLKVKCVDFVSMLEVNRLSTLEVKTEMKTYSSFQTTSGKSFDLKSRNMAPP